MFSTDNFRDLQQATGGQNRPTNWVYQEDSVRLLMKIEWNQWNEKKQTTNGLKCCMFRVIFVGDWWIFLWILLYFFILIFIYRLFNISFTNLQFWTHLKCVPLKPPDTSKKSSNIVDKHWILGLLIIFQDSVCKFWQGRIQCREGAFCLDCIGCNMVCLGAFILWKFYKWRCRKTKESFKVSLNQEVLQY